MVEVGILGKCKWSSESIGLVTFRLRFESHRRSFASYLEQVTNLNLLCAHCSGQLSLLQEMSSSLLDHGVEA